MRCQKTIALVVAAVIAVLFPTIAEACPVCYGDSDSAMAQGANNAVLFLLGVVLLVQAGFVALFYTFWRRSTALRRKREQFRLIQGMRL
ncbi:MAG TPA: hypothetical protein VMS12_00360 [Thermoanaerobaculia bacterium]|nr:hypothetical protein [Thermoanaerobaculia bacterium]